MGYGGLANVLVIEFDTWYNAEWDLLYDHVSVHASPGSGGAGAGTQRGVTSDIQCQLAPPARASIGDGLVHTARVVYWRHLRYDLLPHFTGTSALMEFLLDEGEGRRMGTLAVYMDNATAPLLAMPLNLNAVLELPDNQAYMVR